MYSKNKGPSLLRTVISYPSNSTPTIEFLWRVGKQFKCNSNINSSQRPKSIG